MKRKIKKECPRCEGHIGTFHTCIEDNAPTQAKLEFVEGAELFAVVHVDNLRGEKHIHLCSSRRSANESASGGKAWKWDEPENDFYVAKVTILRKVSQ